MNKSNIILKMNESLFFEIVNLCRECPDLYRYDEIILYLYANNRKHKIFNDFFIYMLDDFEFAIEKVLKNQLILDESIGLDIGLQWNDYRFDPINSSLKKVCIDENFQWVGISYLLCETKENFTWLYIKNNEIIIEITPSYKWMHMDEPEIEDENYIPYNEFIENYKSIDIIKIKKIEIADLLYQIKKLVSIVKANDSKYFKV